MEPGRALQATLNNGPESCTHSDPDDISSSDSPDPVSSLLPVDVTPLCLHLLTLTFLQLHAETLACGSLKIRT